ncbi:MAG TPA: hypothetical protein VHL53_14660 [Acidimicrobiia bacterium]|nr:hypothetical protein [Acidimicrobiia bacterium]
MTDASRFDRVDQTLDRMLGLLQDHGHQLEEVKAGLGEIKGDVRDVRRDLSELQKDFREHLLWDLGRAS